MDGKRFWTLSSSVKIPSNGLVSFICLYLGCKWLLAVAVAPVWHPNIGSRILVSSTRGSGKPGGALKVFLSSTSVSSDSQDSVGVSHGLLSLMIIVRGGSVRVTLWNISSSSRGPSSTLEPSQLHGAMILSSSPLSTIATCCTKGPELSLHSCVRCPQSWKNKHAKIDTERRTKHIHYCDMLRDKKIPEFKNHPGQSGTHRLEIRRSTKTPSFMRTISKGGKNRDTKQSVTFPFRPCPCLFPTRSPCSVPSPGCRAGLLCT